MIWVCHLLFFHVHSPRQIAHQKGVGWTEYWDFLGRSCDLSTPEGLRLLEEFLAGLSPSSEHSTGVEDITQQFTKTTLSDSNSSLSPPNSAQLTSSDFSERESPFPDQADQKSEEHSLNRGLFLNEEETAVNSEQLTPHNSGPPSQTVTGTSKTSEDASEVSVLTGSLETNRAATSPLNTDHNQRMDHGLLDEATTRLEVSAQVGLDNHLQISTKDAESALANSQGNPSDAATSSSAFVTPVRGGGCSRQGLEEEHVFLSG